MTSPKERGEVFYREYLRERISRLMNRRHLDSNGRQRLETLRRQLRELQSEKLRPGVQTQGRRRVTEQKVFEIDNEGVRVADVLCGYPDCGDCKTECATDYLFLAQLAMGIQYDVLYTDPGRASLEEHVGMAAGDHIHPEGVLTAKQKMEYRTRMGAFVGEGWRFFSTDLVMNLIVQAGEEGEKVWVGFDLNGVGGSKIKLCLSIVKRAGW